MTNWKPIKEAPPAPFNDQILVRDYRPPGVDTARVELAFRPWGADPWVFYYVVEPDENNVPADYEFCLIPE